VHVPKQNKGRKMQRKPYQETNFYAQLEQRKRISEENNKLWTFFRFLIVLDFLYESEIQDLPFTRILTMILLLSLYRTYLQFNKEASRELIHYKAAVSFRMAAQENNVERMHEYLKIVTESSVNTCGPETGRNALHFAVRAGAFEAVQYLVEVAVDIDKRRDEFIETLPPDILNHQDNQGNTPVHDAIIDIMTGKRKSYSVLLALISEKIDGKVQPHYTINPGLQNKAKKTISDLIAEINIPHPALEKARALIEALVQYHLEHRESNSVKKRGCR
jgi:Ankyrin repeats (3 copies)